MQFTYLLYGRHNLAPSRPFERLEDEAAFRADYIRGGYSFAVAVMVLGLLMSASFILAANANPLAGTGSLELQLLRATIGAFCGLSLIFLLLDPEGAIRNFHLTIFLPSFVALLGLGLLPFFPRPDSAPAIAFGRSTLSLIIAIWLISTFCRLPLRHVMALSIGASALNIVSLYLHDIEHLPFFALDLAIANIIVWCLTVQTEKRERIIWQQSAEQRRAMRKAQRKAQRATKSTVAQARLIRNISHDIRQPLSSSGIYLSAVSRAASATANDLMQQNIARIGTCLRSVEGTLDRLLESPEKNDALRLKVSSINLADLLQDMRDIFSPQAERMKVDLRFTARCAQTRRVQTNERAMREVLTNLIANALNYTAIANQRRTNVLIGATRIGNMIRVDIVDNGVGIASELQRRIFDEFYRAPTVAGRVKGTGLGLAIVASTLRRLPRHRLRLHSREGKGTRISLYLPCER